MPALILPVHGIFPQIPTDCFIADNATIVGDVVLGRATVASHSDKGLFLGSNRLGFGSRTP